MVDKIGKQVYPQYVTVKNGFATLNDKLFFFDENTELPDSPYFRPCIKASKSKSLKMFFPYDMTTANPIDINDMDETVKDIMMNKARELGFNRRKNGNYFAFNTKEAENFINYKIFLEKSDEN